MNISYDSSKTKLRNLLRKFDNGRLVIPDHQREFVWSLRQQQRLVETVRRGKPIPSILLRVLEDANETTTLEDGHQRLKTMYRYRNNEFAVGGVKFETLSEEEQRKILDYDVITVTYTGATDEEAREIFNDFQNGRPLTFGERLIASQSPIVQFAIRQLLTPGEGYYERLVTLFGAGRTPKARRGADMAIVFALCTGLAFGIDYLSRKWGDAEVNLPKAIDEAALHARLEWYISIWERVHEIAPITTKARRNEYWNLGNFGGYIAYTISIHGTPEANAYNLPVSRDELTELWAQHIVACYHDETLLVRVLHRDLSAARSWKRARWANGLQRLMNVANVVIMEDDSDDDDVIE